MNMGDTVYYYSDNLRDGRIVAELEPGIIYKKDNKMFVVKTEYRTFKVFKYSDIGKNVVTKEQRNIFLL